MPQLPALGFNPQNALIDFSPIGNALDSNRQNYLRQLESNRQDQELAMRKEQLGMDRESHAQNMKNGALDYQAKLAQRSAGIAQMALAEKDPARKAGIMGRLYQMHPDYRTNLAQHGVNPDDHDGVANFLIAEARGYQDPLDRQAKELQVQNARSNLATDALRRTQLQNEIAAGGKPKIMDVDGTLVSVTPTGQASVVYQGQPNATRKPLTEHESKDALFAERMLRSENDLNSVIPIDEHGTFTKYNPTTWRQNFAPDKPGLLNLWSANLINSKEWQQYQRAARESLSAILRKDTGAAVTDEEFNTYFPTYFPVPGDGPEVVLQKKMAREQVGLGLKGSSGRAFDIMFPGSHLGKQPEAQPEPSPQAPKKGGGFKYIGPAP